MRIAALGLLLLLADLPGAGAEEPEAPKAQAFAPAFAATHAEPLHVTDDWILWARAERIPTGQRAEPSHWRWWIQSVATGKTRLFLEYRGRLRLTPVAVQRDGTVLLAHIRTIHWYHPDDGVAGDPRTHPRSESPHPKALGFKTNAVKFKWIRGTPAGAIAQPDRTMTHQAAWWIPFEGRALDWKRRKRITERAGLYVNHTVTYHPAGKELAWNGFVFDTTTGKGRAIPHGVRGHARAFDGTWVADFYSIIRVADGWRRKLPTSRQVFAIRQGRAYAVSPTGGPDQTKLLAIDCRDGRITGLHAMPTPRMTSSLHYQDRANVLHIHKQGGGPYLVFWNRLGIHHWVNDHWRFQPWLPAKY